ncbi:uncharacterized protein LOC142337630 isoform X2 [Convolutriloba macropyga]|uniref:uncharacterized protein LOC142337630 isoform X2 n=1 Tax=Convolutriloba macropyga TaxID=536237 RepID=UPI003F524A59
MGFWKQLVLACNRNVESIDKSRCNLREVPPEVLRYAKTLLELNLEINYIESLPPEFWRFTRLRYLNISENGIRQLSSQITSFVLLTHLDISHNEIRVLPEEIHQLVNLTYLDISRNSLLDGQAPEGLWKLRSLTKLLMNDVCLLEIPESVSGLNKLERLELRDNFLKTLPMGIGALTRLRLLDLGGNDLYELPYEIGDLTSLKDMYLDDNVLVELPKTMGDLSSLESLDVTKNELEYLPDQLGSLSKLSELLLDCNILEILPPSLFSHLKQLNRLKVTENMLGSIPPSWSHCVSLTEIFFTSNSLKEIPDSIGCLVNLRSANFDQNGIRNLPETIGNCCRLGVLSLRDNCLSSIPASVEKLTELYVLDLTNNRLEWLPFSVQKLSNLKALWLSETQGSKSLPVFSAEMRGNKKVLTCEYLPQKTGSMENLLMAASMTSLYQSDPRFQYSSYIATQQELDESGEYDTGETEAAGRPEAVIMRPRAANEIELLALPGATGGDSGSKRESKVSFEAGDVEMVDDNQLDQYTTELKRHHTPHPRELALRREEGRIMGHRADSGRRRQETHISLASSSPGATTPNPTPNSTPAHFQRPPVSSSALSSSSSPPQQTIETQLRQQQQLSMRPFIGGASGTGGASGRTTVSVDVNPLSPDQISVEVENENYNRKMITEQSSSTRVGASGVKFDMNATERMSGSGDQNVSSSRPPPPTRSEVSRTSAASANALVAKSQQGATGNVNGNVQMRGYNRPPSAHHRAKSVSTSSEEQEGEYESSEEEDSEVSREKTVGFSDDVTLTTASSSVHARHDSDANNPISEDSTYPSTGQATDLVTDEMRLVGIESVVQLRRKKQPTREATFLARRDTPHHKKGKRLLVGDSDAQRSELTEEELQQILSGASQHYPTSPNSNKPQQGQPYLLYSDQDKYEFEDRQFVSVVTRGAGVGFGLTIAGGRGSQVPYRPGDEGIFLSNVIVNSPAFNAGLRVGDKILSVDGSELTGADHATAVDILRNTMGVSITLTVERRIYRLSPAVDSQVPGGDGRHHLDSEESESITSDSHHQQHQLNQSNSLSSPQRVKSPVGSSSSNSNFQQPRKQKPHQVNYINIGPAKSNGFDHNSSSVPLASPFFTIEVRLRRQQQQGFGFSFHSVTSSSSSGTAAAGAAGASGLRVTKIVPGGVAASEGTLRIGDLIQSINEVDVTTGIEGRDSAVNILRSVLEVCIILVRKTTTASGPDSNHFTFPEVSNETTGDTAKLDRVPSSSSRRGNRVHSPATSPPPSKLTSDTSEPMSTAGQVVDNNLQPSITSARLMQDPVNGTLNVQVQNQSKIAPSTGVHDDEPGGLDHVEEVVLVKTGEPLGFSIKGGTDHPMHICGLRDTSVYISKIMPEGLAARSNLVVGDKVLFANGVNLQGLTHSDAVTALVSPPSQIIDQESELECLTLLVAHECFLSGYKQISLKKHLSELWGLVIQGGIGYKSANPYEHMDESIYVTGVVPFSPADNCTQLQPGQRIIQMNNKSMVGVSYPEAKHELSSSKFELTITVCDGFNSPQGDAATKSSPAQHQFKRPPTSVPGFSQSQYQPHHENKSISSIVETASSSRS